MRPSWPPPRMPIVASGWSTRRAALTQIRKSLGASATAAVWPRARHRAGSLNADRSSAKTLAASSAALMAPAWPIASVPTGTPGGICTIEYSES